MIQFDKNGELVCHRGKAYMSCHPSGDKKNVVKAGTVVVWPSATRGANPEVPMSTTTASEATFKVNIGTKCTVEDAGIMDCARNE